MSVLTQACPLGFPVWAGWLHLDRQIESQHGSSDLIADLTEIGNKCADRTVFSESANAVIQLIAKTCPALLSPDATLVEPPRNWLDDTLDNVGSLVSFEERFPIQRRLLEIIDAGNRMGRFQVHIHRIPVPPIPEPASPFQHVAFEHVIDLAQLTNRFVATLENRQALDAKLAWGRLLLSAMLFGGLTQARWLLAIEKALPNAEASIRWLDLQIEGEQAALNAQAPILHLRRWFPDPLTQLFLRQLRARSVPTVTVGREARTLAASAMRLIMAYVKHQGFQRNLPSSFSKLAMAVQTRLSLHLPPFLVAYASGRLESTSLPLSTWRRLLEPPTALRLDLIGLQAIDVPPPGGLPVDHAPESPDLAKRELRREPDEALWPAQLRELGRLVRHGPPADMGERIGKWKARTVLIPSVDCLAGWIIEWLLAGHKKQHKLRPSTIYRMLNCAGSRVVALLGYRKLDKLGDESDYVELVEDVLEDIEAPATRRRAALAMRSLCEFLAKKRSAPSMADDGAFKVAGKDGHAVDANLISVGTFRLALQGLYKGAIPGCPSDQGLKEALCVIATLGFFAGLRRSEALGLRMEDLEISLHEVYLHVRPNRLRLLKTNNAHRQLPLHLLLPDDCLLALRRFASSRREDDAADDDALFPTFADASGVRSSASQLRPITDALQAAAGDTTLRFHHLRHSFANWLAVKFWLADQRADASPDLKDPGAAIASGAVEDSWIAHPDDWKAIMPGWFVPSADDRDDWATSLLLRHTMLGRASTNRRALYQISQLLGHGSPVITLGSYVHLTDFLLGRTVRRMTPHMEDDQLAAVAGIDLDSVRRLRRALRRPRADDANARLLDAILAGPLPAGRRRRNKAVLPTIASRPDSAVARPMAPYERLLHETTALALLCDGKQSSQNIANRFDLSGAKLRKAASLLGALPNGYAEYAGGLSTFANSSPSSGIRIDVPRGPTQNAIGRYVLTTFHRLTERTTELPCSAERANSEPGEPLPISGDALRRMNEVLHVAPIGWLRGTALDMQFSGVVAARYWLWFVKELGLGSAIIATHLPISGPHAKHPDSQVKHWATAFEKLSVPIGDSAHSDRHHVATNGGTHGAVRISFDTTKVLTPPFPRCGKITALGAVRLVLASLYVFPHLLVPRHSPAP